MLIKNLVLSTLKIIFIKKKNSRTFLKGFGQMTVLIIEDYFNPRVQCGSNNEPIDLALRLRDMASLIKCTVQRFHVQRF